jgi:stress response protein YsnF
MPFDLYWHGDPALVKHYRKAAKLKLDNDNFSSWLQGKYYYDALLCVAPILHAFAKKGTKANPYHTEPYLFESKTSEDEVVKKEEQEMFKMKELFEAAMVRINKNIAEKKKTPPPK